MWQGCRVMPRYQPAYAGRSPGLWLRFVRGRETRAQRGDLCGVGRPAHSAEIGAGLGDPRTARSLVRGRQTGTQRCGQETRAQRASEIGAGQGTWARSRDAAFD